MAIKNRLSENRCLPDYLYSRAPHFFCLLSLTQCGCGRLSFSLWLAVCVTPGSEDLCFLSSFHARTHTSALLLKKSILSKCRTAPLLIRSLLLWPAGMSQQKLAYACTLSCICSVINIAFCFSSTMPTQTAHPSALHGFSSFPGVLLCSWQDRNDSFRLFFSLHSQHGWFFLPFPVLTNVHSSWDESCIIPQTLQRDMDPMMSVPVVVCFPIAQNLIREDTHFFHK